MYQLCLQVANNMHMFANDLQNHCPYQKIVVLSFHVLFVSAASLLYVVYMC